jgi:hypothetical protein
MTGEMRVYGSGRWRGAPYDPAYQQAVDEVESVANRTAAERAQLIAELSVDHAAEYSAWRDRYLQSGDIEDLDHMLTHVVAG